jgi:hypothetical protein
MTIKAMTTKDEATHLDNLRKHIHISEKIDIIMEQSLKLMDIVTENQKAVNDLKAEQDKLKGDK